MDYGNQMQWNDLALHMPTSFDDDFLAMLQRQINAANPQQLLINPNKFPAPPIEHPTPPLSEESSPGPSEDQSNSPVLATRSSRRVSGQAPLHDFTSSLLAHRDSQDDPHKRKAHDEDSDDDDEDGPPTHKSQHRSNDNDGSSSKKAGGSRRKSGGDDNRLLKRKEQNRAAQRAFRERKEKHVKDLEDKVADLEAKNEGQLTENDNLRDLLTRLQNENVLLKQAAFTFSFPRNGSATTGSSANPSPYSGPGSNFSPMFSSAGSSSNSPPLLPGGSNGQFSSLFGNTPPGATPSPPSSQGYNSYNSFQGASQLGMNSVRPTNTPYTIIASNPLCTSSSDPYQSNWASFGPAAADAQFSSPNLQGVDTGINTMGLGHTSTSLSPFNTGQFTPGSTLEAMLGNTMDTSSCAGYGFTSPGIGPISPQNSQGRLQSQMNLSGLTPLSDESSVGGSFNFDPTDPDYLMRLDSNSSVNSTTGHKTCPKSKEDMTKIIQSTPQSTFGPPVVSSQSQAGPSSTPSSSSSRSPASNVASLGQPQSHISSSVTAPGVDPLAELCAGLPQTQRTVSHIEIGEAWDRARTHPWFKDVDIDELCHELSSKAKCDGNKPVLETEIVDTLINDMARRGRK